MMHIKSNINYISYITTYSVIDENHFRNDIFIHSFVKSHFKK